MIDEKLAEALIQTTPAPEPPAEPEPEIEAVEDDQQPLDALDEEPQEDGETFEEEEEDGETSPESEEVYRFKSNGEFVEKTIDELIEAAQLGDATKTRLNEATEAREKAVEEGYAEARAQIQPQIEAIESARQNFEDVAGVINEVIRSQLREKPDPSMRETDPIGYPTAMEDWRESMENLNQVQGKIAQAQAKANEMRQALEAENRTTHQRQLFAKRPELREPEAGKAFTANVYKAAEAIGFTPDDVAALVDHRALIGLDKLGSFLAQVGGDAPGKRVVEKVRKPMKPGGVKYTKTKRQKQRRANYEKAKSTGDYKDIAKLIVE